MSDRPAVEERAPAPRPAAATDPFEDLRAGRTPRQPLPQAAEIYLLETGHLQHRYDARSYSVVYGWWKRRELVHREAKKALAGVARPSVLEVGCHKGGELIALARDLGRPGRFAGVDLSLEFVRFAKLWSSVREVPGASWGVCDAQALPYRDQSFDVLITTEVVEHLPDPQRAVAEFARVLRPGGTAIVSTVNPSTGVAAVGRFLNRFTGGRLRSAVREGMGDHDHDHEHEHDHHSYEETAEFGTRDPGHVSEFPLGRWASILRRAGFTGVRVHPGAMVYGGSFYDRHRLLFAAFLAAESTLQKLPGFSNFCTAGTIVARRTG